MATAWYRTKDIWPANGQDVVWLDSLGNEHKGRYFGGMWEEAQLLRYAKVDWWRPLTESKDVS